MIHQKIVRTIKEKRKNNREWLDELINKIESANNRISNTY